MPDQPNSKGTTGWDTRKRVAIGALLAILLYAVLAYVFVPLIWSRYSHRHPSLEDLPGMTYTANGIPGDPLNIALIGTKAEVIQIMLAANWHPADSLSLKSCLEIAEATVLERPYADAPVSSLYLWDRKEDFAFEQAVGNDPRHRHHIRFWRSPKNDWGGRPIWVGSGTYDKGVGLSHTTGQITHHIAEDVDAERDHVISSLKQTGELSETYFVDGFHKTLTGKNGGGDPWKTDGRLYVGIIVAKARTP